MFVFAGMDTGLGVFRTPAYCWVAIPCALIAAVCSAKRRRWYWIIAGAAAVVCSIYGYQQNSKWRERVEHFPVKQAPPPAEQPESNR